MVLMWEDIDEDTEVPQGEHWISRSFITTDDRGPCIFFLVNFIYQLKPVCYLSHYDFKGTFLSNLSQFETYIYCLKTIVDDIEFAFQISSIIPTDLMEKLGFVIVY
ncbi:unnamed protein product [Adineta steineri]|uniref:Uncharacterized protein n=1 Tax=Adineta steineri TaxID=433720 RepID=A0A818U779_9BILA|nr:unnamed protein product [Adineta steineri]CAF3694376.1 unnamed protein product [Adineta steineri]